MPGRRRSPRADGRLEAIARQIVGVQEEIGIVTHHSQYLPVHVVFEVADGEDGVPVPHPALQQEEERAVLGVAVRRRELVRACSRRPRLASRHVAPLEAAVLHGRSAHSQNVA